MPLSESALVLVVRSAAIVGAFEPASVVGEEWEQLLSRVPASSAPMASGEKRVIIDEQKK
jgi:hypothetical protein